MSKTKRCAGPCGRELPATTDHFHSDASHVDGLKTRCRECRAGTTHKTGRRLVVDTKDKLKPVEEKLPPVVEHRLKAKVAGLELRVKGLLEDLDNAQKLVELRREVGEQHVVGIRPRERKPGKLREATALVCASDWHIEESVKPEQVAGRNRYDLDIAQHRMQRFFEATRYAVEFNRQIFVIRDMVLWIGGDIINNYLRDENLESNLLSPPRAIAFAVASLSAGIRYLLEDGQLERIVIPCNDGNHGRLNGREKIKHSTRVDNSLEWLMYTMLEREFADEPRVEFQIAAGEILYLDIYGRTVRFLHGDIVHYAGGVGGVTIPLYKAVARWDTVRRADLTVLGHFHQLTSLPDLIINGSLIGYSPYSATIGARFEAPAQAFTILDPQRFKSIAMPLWVSERDDDEQTRDVFAERSARRAEHKTRMRAKVPHYLDHK